ncbi:beta-1,6-galactosyltransferase GALT29A-like [Abrus precatorius]|uniref:Beta-1,6-galactosyltransferase GALT29A-like n=1 Tax=Abrus precatorius TaxID=3816 RepID=A0A8B8KHW8_ABRPR|nr:beta-1,6-galactosyltransferase GALT29A-like [Abrus precatorius]
MISQNKHGYAICSIKPIKFSFRPLFALLLLFLFTATLTSRTMLSQSKLTQKMNTLLLNYATIDSVEEQWNQEIQQLLDSSLGNESRVPVALRSALFQRYLPHFQEALNDWAMKRNNKSSQPDIMLELTRLVKHPIEKHKGLVGSDHKKYQSCAVVGNSGILLNTNYGKLIDSNEVVIRLNHARVEGFENKVGSKTNISFVNSNVLHACGRIVGSGCLCHTYGADVATIMYLCQPAHIMDYTVCNSFNKTPLMVTDPRFDMVCARIVKYYSLKRFVMETGMGLKEWGPAHDEAFFHYSSGFQAFMLALGICEKVSMFGFGKSGSAKHHYHTNQRAELHLHDYEAEYAFYRDIVDGHRPIPFLSDEFHIPPVLMYR